MDGTVVIISTSTIDFSTVLYSMNSVEGGVYR